MAEWEYDPTDRTSGAPEAIWDGGQIIARVEDCGGPTREHGRLIAAAPDLRAFAEVVLNSADVPYRLREQARAVLQKASVR